MEPERWEDQSGHGRDLVAPGSTETTETTHYAVLRWCEVSDEWAEYPGSPVFRSEEEGRAYKRAPGSRLIRRVVTVREEVVE